MSINGFEEFQEGKQPEQVYYYDYEKGETVRCEVPDKVWEMARKVYDDENEVTPQSIIDLLKYNSNTKTNIV